MVNKLPESRVIGLRIKTTTWSKRKDTSCLLRLDNKLWYRVYSRPNGQLYIKIANVVHDVPFDPTALKVKVYP